MQSFSGGVYAAEVPIASKNDFTSQQTSAATGSEAWATTSTTSGNNTGPAGMGVRLFAGALGWIRGRCGGTTDINYRGYVR